MRHEQYCGAALPQEQQEMQLCLQWGDQAGAQRDGWLEVLPSPETSQSYWVVRASMIVVSWALGTGSITLTPLPH